MTAELLQIQTGDGTPKQILFAAHADDYSPSTNNVIAVGSPTVVEITIEGITDTSARQSVKADLGVLWAPRYAVKVAIEFFSNPTAGEVVQFFWSFSDQSGAAVGNEGGASGSNASYTGYGSLSDSIRQLVYLGALPVVSSSAVQIMTVGYLDATSRYGSLIIVNESGVTLAGTDGIETAVALTPVVMQGQDT